MTLVRYYFESSGELLPLSGKLTLRLDQKNTDTLVMDFKQMVR